MHPSSPSPRCKNLVLDAGPLLSLSPLRGLAETYLTVPQVLNELKDKRAREHFERLGLNAGVKIEVREADKTALAHGMSIPSSTKLHLFDSCI
jgi:RNA-binding protein NOB1